MILDSRTQSAFNTYSSASTHTGRRGRSCANSLYAATSLTRSGLSITISCAPMDHSARYNQHQWCLWTRSFAFNTRAFYPTNTLKIVREWRGLYLHYKYARGQINPHNNNLPDPSTYGPCFQIPIATHFFLTLCRGLSPVATIFVELLTFRGTQRPTEFWSKIVTSRSITHLSCYSWPNRRCILSR